MKLNKVFCSLSLISTLGFTASLTSCSKNVVKLSGYTDAGTVGTDWKDYWVCAEPAASVRLSLPDLKLNRVASIQDLYGGNGFNQAILVCKKTLLDNNPLYLNQVKQYLQGNETYIADTENLGDIKSFTGLNNATTDSLVRCSAKYVEFVSDQTQYKSFLAKAKNIDSSVELPSSDDFYSGFPSASETKTTDSYTIMYPQGAPAVALANMYKNKDSLSNATTFKSIAASQNIFTEIISKEPELAILPSNLAAKLYNHSYETSNVPYVWLSTVTWGNLYLLSKDATPISKSNLKDKLLNKEIGVIQLQSTPGLAFKIILEDNNIKYEA